MLLAILFQLRLSLSQIGGRQLFRHAVGRLRDAVEGRWH